MPSASPERSKRIVLIVLGSLVGVAALAAVGAYGAFRHFAPDLRAIGVAVEGEAAQFAKSHTAHDCVGEAVVRGTRDADFMGGVKARVFLKYCLAKIERPAGFCDGVPRYGEI